MTTMTLEDIEAMEGEIITADIAAKILQCKRNPDGSPSKPFPPKIAEELLRRGRFHTRGVRA